MRKVEMLMRWISACVAMALLVALSVATPAVARPAPVWLGVSAASTASDGNPEEDPEEEPEDEDPEGEDPEPSPEDDDETEESEADSDGDADDADSEEATDEDEEAEEEDEDQDRFLALTNAEIHTISDGVIANGTILSKNGVIHAIGRRVTIPEGAETIDATGHRIYPGLVAVRSSAIIGSRTIEDTTDVYSLAMNLALAGGITTAVSGNNAGKLSWGSIEDLPLKNNLFFEIRYATSNPKSRRDLRDGLETARQYIRDLEAFRRAKRSDPDTEMEEPDDAPTKGRAGEYLKLIKGERTAVAVANEAQDLIELAMLAEEFDFELVIRGAYEGWTVAPQLARANVSVIVTPRSRVRPDDELNRPTGSSIENAAILRRHGVRLAIVPQQTVITLWGLGGQDLQHLPLEAAFAVRGGLPQRDAIRAITLDAAKILGVDHRVGSLEVGKDADMIVTDGDLLHYLTHVTHSFVNGRLVYEKSEDSLFNHIRPAGDADAPPPDDHWPRRLGAEY